MYWYTLLGWYYIIGLDKSGVGMRRVSANLLCQVDVNLDDKSWNVGTFLKTFSIRESRIYPSAKLRDGSSIFWEVFQNCTNMSPPFYPRRTHFIHSYTKLLIFLYLFECYELLDQIIENFLSCTPYL